MKNNQTIAMLVGILFITTAASAWLSLRFTSTLRARQRVQAHLLAIQNGEGAIKALANDVVEYSKKNPQINPIVKDFGLLPNGGQPATKPAGR